MVFFLFLFLLFLTTSVATVVAYKTIPELKAKIDNVLKKPDKKEEPSSSIENPSINNNIPSSIENNNIPSSIENNNISSSIENNNISSPIEQPPKDNSFDCTTSDWFPSGSCVPNIGNCGLGKQKYYRTIKINKIGNGKECPVLEKSEDCDAGYCPIDCVPGEWDKPELVCPTTCGLPSQTIKRNRIKKNEAKNGGKECVVEETKDCPSTAPCPIDCVGNEWDEPACPTGCGKPSSYVTKSRTIKTHAQNGGKECALTELKYCPETEPCGNDCVPNEWFPSDYECPPPACGQPQTIKTRIRTRKHSAVNGGQDCILTESKICPASDPCPIDCVVSDWTQTSTCSKPCGNGTATFTRTIVREAKNGGMECPPLTKTDVCNIFPCPIDCVPYDWVDPPCPTECGKLQSTIIKTRTVKTPAQHGGKECVLSEPKTCPSTMPCPIDCVPDVWFDTPCPTECGRPQTTVLRTRGIKSPALYGGKECILTEPKICPATIPCPIDCIVTPWIQSSSCSQECGGGTQSFSRIVLQNSAHSGALCPPLSTTMSCNQQPCPTDCIPNEWYDPPCPTECGKLQTTLMKTRTVKTPATNGGKECILTEPKICPATTPCPVDCVVSNWMQTSTCSATCGGGLASFARYVSQNSAHGGATCPPLTKTDICNTQPCPIDCAVSEWKPLTASCSVTCGGGTQSFYRTVTRNVEYGGAACPPLTKTEACNVQPCPGDCVPNDWLPSDYECSTACDQPQTIKTRTRTVKTPATNGGKECILSESKTCPATVGCPVDCVVSDWSATSECTQTCGGGTQNFGRTILKEPQNGGLACPSLRKIDVCNAQPCPIDCTTSEWNEPSCPTQCGLPPTTVIKTRTMITPAQNGGKCVLSEPKSCPSIPCPIDCIPEPWDIPDTMFNCPDYCGAPSTIKTRNRKVAFPAFNGGKECSLTESKTCPAMPGCPLNCIVGAWNSPELVCPTTCGQPQTIKTRTRPVLTPASNNGEPCPALTDTKVCPPTTPCPIDCVPNEWDDPPCSTTCGQSAASVIKTRTVKTPAQYGGKECTLSELKFCPATAPCPSDCIPSDWDTPDSLFLCPTICGLPASTKTRNRFVTVPAKNGGKECTLTETKSCPATTPCPVDCVVSGWTQTSSCSASCGGGIQSFSRTITQEPRYGGLTCPPLTKTEACNIFPCPVDCIPSQWNIPDSSFICPTACGRPSTTIYRNRAVTSPALNGGKECTLTETKICPETTPCPSDCVPSDWNISDADFACPTVCGLPETTKTRTRTRVKNATNNGNDCILSETKTCPATAPCPADCVPSEWSMDDATYACTSICGVTPMTKTRTRTRKILAVGTGKDCTNFSESHFCPTIPCPTDCVPTEWNDPPCPTQCGLPQTTVMKTRSVRYPATNGGNDCILSEPKTCPPTAPCPIDCVPGEWDSPELVCPTTCGSIAQTIRRTRPRLVQPSYGGKDCIVVEAKDCPAIPPCPVDCVVTDWTPITSCTVECGGGVRTFRRYISTQPENGGAACPVLSKQEPCNTQACGPVCNADLYSNCPDWATSAWCTTYKSGGEALRQCAATCKSRTNDDYFCKGDSVTVPPPSSPPNSGYCRADLYPNCSSWAGENWCNNNKGGEANRQCPTTCALSTGDTSFCNDTSPPPNTSTCKADLYPGCSSWATTSWCSTFKGGEADRQCSATCRAVTGDNYFCNGNAPAAPVCKADLYSNCPDWATTEWCTAYKGGEANRQCSATCKTRTNDNTFC